MALSFLSLWNQLRQYVPALSPEQAQDYINQGWRDVRQAQEEWSFLYAVEYWQAPASISLTGLTLTQFSDVVGLNATNVAQLAGLNNSALTLRQLRFGLSGGPIYRIESADVGQVTDAAITSGDTTLTSVSTPWTTEDVGSLIVVEGAGAGGSDLATTIASFTNPSEVELTDAAGTTVSGATASWGSELTLDRPYTDGEDTTAGSALCYQVYYSPLSTDFQRIDHLTDQITGYEFGWEIQPGEDLDRIDPRRSSQTLAYRLFMAYYDDETGLPVYELWPGPTAQRTFKVTYWRLGTDLVDDTDTLPPQLADELVLLKARILAYEWAMTQDPDPRMRQSYQTACQWCRSRYSTEGQPGAKLGLLDTAIRRDRSVFLTKFKRRPHGYRIGLPIDSNFAQSHDMTGRGLY